MPKRTNSTKGKQQIKSTAKKEPLTPRPRNARPSPAADKKKNALLRRFHPKSEEVLVKRAQSGERLLQVPKRIWYKPLTWRHRPPVPKYKPLPKARKIFWSALKLLWQHRRLFFWLVLVYGILDILLVRGLSGSSDLSSIKSTLDGVLHGVGGKLATSAITFTYLVASSGSSNTGASGSYEILLLAVCSLAFIWALRQVLAGHVVRMRDSFYQGMYPLVPFILLFLLLSLQLLPLAAGGGIYANVVAGGIAIHLWEKIFWAVLFALLSLWSLRMITASVIALYIVTLPNMTPLRAYRSAKKLVYGRRLLLWRKFIFLPFILLILAALIEFPLILFATPIAEWTFFIVSMIALPVVHAYLYTLYREML